VGVVTAAADSTDLVPIRDLNLIVKPSPQSTCFENIYLNEGRKQRVFSRAVGISSEDVPREWWDTGLVHIAPLMRELTIDIVELFQGSFIGLTPQGLMRESDSEGQISALPLQDAADFIEASDAVVLGIEDMGVNPDAALEVAELCSVMAITSGAQGARVWADNEWRSFTAPSTDEIDATGAGDIFAAAFFSRLHSSGNPWMAAETAIQLATASVSRSGLSGAPTPGEVQDTLSRESF
jgi:hypothetical protein